MTTPSDFPQALLADVTERQKRISATREASRTLADPTQLREAQQQVQEGIDEVTLVCKRVKVSLRMMFCRGQDRWDGRRQLLIGT
jgi:hypothetical protein